MRLGSIHDYNQLQQKRYAAKTGFVVDIEKLGKNTATFVEPVKSTLEEISNGVWLSINPITFSDGNFTNVYDMFWDAHKVSLSPYIYSLKRPFYLFDFIRRDPSILAVINGSFFFLVDNKGVEPKDSPFHFCVRNGRIMGLLSSDEPVIYTKDGVLEAQELRAIGTMQIGNRIIRWVGSNHQENKSSSEVAVLFNSGSAKILKSFDAKTGVRNGFLDNNHIHTPNNPAAADLVVNQDKAGNLFIEKVNKGGDTHYFDGLFILQVSGDISFKVGEIVKPLTLDKLKLDRISSAITIGKSVHDPYFFVQERVASRDARSVIAQDIVGNIHFMVFDGSKYIPKFKGVSANDISEYFSKKKFKWAYFLDGGSSSRIIIRHKSRYRFLANEFAFKRIGLDLFLWDWKRHRKLASSIALRINNIH